MKGKTYRKENVLFGNWSSPPLVPISNTCARILVLSKNTLGLRLPQWVWSNRSGRGFRTCAGSIDFYCHQKNAKLVDIFLWLRRRQRLGAKEIIKQASKEHSMPRSYPMGTFFLNSSEPWPILITLLLLLLLLLSLPIPITLLLLLSIPDTLWGFWIFCFKNTWAVVIFRSLWCYPPASPWSAWRSRSSWGSSRKKQQGWRTGWWMSELVVTI